MAAKWTAEEDAVLVRYMRTHGPTEIAKLIGTKNRSAVGSRISRIRAKQQKELDKVEAVKLEEPKEEKPEPAEPEVKKPEPEEKAEAPKKPKKFHTPKLLTVVKLHPIEKIENNGCRWPIGDLRHPDFRFCGERVNSSGPYCTAHKKIAFTPSPVPRQLRQLVKG